MVHRSYDARTGAWDGVRNIDVLAFETAASPTAASRAWNCHTQSWLGRYASQRLPRAASKFGTYALSAFWHGLYPGYYLFFLSAPAVQHLEAVLGAKVAPRVRALGVPAVSAAYDLVCRVGTSAALGYFVLPFIALGWDDGMRAWARLWYAGHAAVAALALALALLPARHHHHGHHHGHAKQA